MFQLKRLNENITGLRGLASISIVVLHLYNGPKDNGWFSIDEIDFGRYIDFVVISQAYWVEVFFMISGYLIADTLTRHRNILQFAWNRFWRVYPTYFILTNLIFFASLVLGLDVITNPKGFSIESIYTVNILMLSGILPHPAYLNVAWSLSYEFVFYVFSAFAFIFWHKRSYLTRPLLCILALLLINLYPRAAFFLTGYVVFVYSYYFEELRIRNLVQSLSIPFVFVFLFLLEAASRNDASNDFDRFYLAAFFLSFPVFYGLTTDRQMITAVLRTRVFQYLGMISYGLYLWHPCVEFVAKKIVLVSLPGADPFYKIMLLASLVLPSSLIAATFNFRIIETRLPQLVSRCIRRSRSSLA